jgi:hypothetical protein
MSFWLSLRWVRCAAIALIVSVSIASSEEAKYASIISVIANPNQHNNQRIITSGYLFSGHGRLLLYPNKSDAENGLIENSIPLLANSKEAAKEVNQCTGKYVRVSGKFVLYKPESVLINQGYIEASEIVLTSEYFKNTEGDERQKGSGL